MGKKGRNEHTDAERNEGTTERKIQTKQKGATSWWKVGGMPRNDEAKNKQKYEEGTGTVRLQREVQLLKVVEKFPTVHRMSGR
jgi:hypothetical protein